MINKTYLVSGYYNDTVTPPRVPGELACTIRCSGEDVKNTEVRIFESRPDIGDVIVREKK